MYVDPHAGRLLFATHARQWLDSRNDELTTKARDASIMHTHVLPQWGTWPLSKIDHLSVQTWVTELGARRAPATVAEAHRLASAVLRSAVRNRLIAFNPCESIRLPRRRRQDTADQVISRDELRSKLLPAAPDRYRAIIATVHRAAARLVGADHPGNLNRYPGPADAPIYANAVGKPLRRTLFRSRVWRPALVHAGMLDTLTAIGDDTVRAGWADDTGATLDKEFATEREAVLHIAKSCAGGLRFHDLRHSYATWLEMTGCR